MALRLPPRELLPSLHDAQFGRDLETIIHALYPLQLQIDQQLDAWPADVQAYEEQEFAIYRSVCREGIPL